MACITRGQTDEEGGSEVDQDFRHDAARTAENIHFSGKSLISVGLRQRGPSGEGGSHVEGGKKAACF